MYRVIKASGGLSGSYPFTQNFGEPYISPELWDRVQKNVLTWQDIMEKFQSIVDEYFPDEEKIEAEIYKLYSRNRQSKAYQEAWRRWNEDSEYEVDASTAISAASEESPWIQSIFDFEGMSSSEISQWLDDAPDGSQILDVCSKPDRWKIDTIIKKACGYVSNYYNPISSPHDWKSMECWWEVSGSKNMWFGPKYIRQILDGTHKYYQVSPRAKR